MKQFILPLLLLQHFSWHPANDSKTEETNTRTTTAADDELNTRISAVLRSFYRGTLDTGTRMGHSRPGYHKFDSKLSIPNEAAKADTLTFVKAQLDSLKAYEVAKLTLRILPIIK